MRATCSICSTCPTHSVERNETRPMVRVDRYGRSAPAIGESGQSQFAPLKLRSLALVPSSGAQSAPTTSTLPAPLRDCSLRAKALRSQTLGHSAARLRRFQNPPAVRNTNGSAKSTGGCPHPPVHPPRIAFGRIVAAASPRASDTQALRAIRHPDADYRLPPVIVLFWMYVVLFIKV